MKVKIILVLVFGFMAVSLTGCAILNKPVQFVDKFIGKTFFPPYSGNKANIIVADFEVKTAKADTQIGKGLRDMLVAGLEKTNRFSVLPLLEDETKKNASLIIATEVVEFEPRASGGSLGVGGGGSASSGTLGSLLGSSVNKSSIALNIRIVDAASSKVLDSKRIIGQAVDSERSANIGYKRSPKSLNEGLLAYANTSMEEAIYNCILDAVRYVVEKVPTKYYKGDKNGKT